MGSRLRLSVSHELHRLERHVAQVQILASLLALSDLEQVL